VAYVGETGCGMVSVGKYVQSLEIQRVYQDSHCCGRASRSVRFLEAQEGCVAMPAGGELHRAYRAPQRSSSCSTSRLRYACFLYLL
jgi:hypothetical protein